MSAGWYSCYPTAGPSDAICCLCGVVVLAQPVPPAGQILCDHCFDRCYEGGQER